MYNPANRTVHNSSTRDEQIMLCGLVANTQYEYKVRSMVGSDYSNFVSDTFATFPNGEQYYVTCMVCAVCMNMQVMSITNS